MGKSHIPGVSIAIIHDGKVVLARGYGMANVELSVPATENNRLSARLGDQDPSRRPQS